MKIKRQNLIISLIVIIYCNLSFSQQVDHKNLNGSSGYIEVDGSQLNFQIKGEGRACLVIGSSVYYPKTFSGDIGKQLKMYFVDMKWFAEKYKAENLDLVNIQSIVQDVEEIRQKLELDKPLILGHSIHGTIAAEYVKKHADKVSGLIVIGSPCEWGNSTYDKKAAELWKTASDVRKKVQEENWGKIDELDRLTGQEKASAQYNSLSPKYWYDPYYDASWLWDGMTVHPNVTEHLFAQVFLNYNMFDPAVSISVPVFVGLGKYDYVIPYTLWQLEYSTISKFTLVLFENSGHTPQLEESELFNRKIIEWLENN